LKYRVHAPRASSSSGFRPRQPADRVVGHRGDEPSMGNASRRSAAPGLSVSSDSSCRQ
jgi:hypothetical protein